MNKEQIQAELRLFKAYTDDKSLFVGEVNKEALEKGVVIIDPVLDDVKNEAIEMYGIKDEWQNTFHKSFQTVLDTPIETLVAQQIIHYFTTYGLEALGIFNTDLVYIPSEELDIPEFEGKIKLVVINKITELELTQRLMELLTSGIALARKTVEDVMILSDYLDKDKFDEITNKEVKLALYEKYGIVPKNNEEFLKYLVFKLTGSTLFIKNKEMYNSLKNADSALAEKYLKAYIKKDGKYDKLAEIFLKHKPIFLALKRPNNKSLNYIINKIRRRAITQHKPTEPMILDRLTSIYKMSDDGNTFYYNDKVSLEKNDTICEMTRKEISVKTLGGMLKNIPIFREIRILNALRYRLSANSKSILYRVRNGKTYVEDLPTTVSTSKYEAQKRLIEVVEANLNNRLKESLDGKTIYIPENVTYMAPTTEKQFLGNFPIGTSITLPRKDNMIVGVHWENGDDRVDLDLHAYTRNGHYGWNGSYYGGDDVIFSGDVTDAPAPQGATECFRISHKALNTSFLLKLKNFTANHYDVPFEFIVATSKDSEISKNYTINPNNIITKLNLNIEWDGTTNTRPDEDLALIEVLKDEIKITFINYSTDKSISSFKQDTLEKVLSYTENFPLVQVTLNDLLETAGCELSKTPTIETMEEVKVVNDEGIEEILYKKKVIPVDYDLSPEVITKDTFIKLLTEGK